MKRIQPFWSGLGTPGSPNSCRCFKVLKFCAVGILAMAAFSIPGHGQRSRAANRQHAAAAQFASFGPLVPGKLGTPGAVALPFSLSVPAATVARGYRVSAVSSFVFTPTASLAGGKSVTAADIGVGVLGVSSLLGSNVAVTPGFAYDPAVARSGNGRNSYPGAAYGLANLADLVAGQNIINVGRISAGQVPPSGDELTLFVKIAMSPQYLTPGGFSGTIILIVAE